MSERSILTPNFTISLLGVCAFLVFVGHAYQFYFFGAPFRALLWDESLLSPLVESVFQERWASYATSARTDSAITLLIKTCAVLLMVAAVVSLLWQRIASVRTKHVIVWIGIGILLVYGICLVKDRMYNVLYVFELGIQLAAPLLLVLFADRKVFQQRKLLLYARIAVAVTFVPHGLFAMGIPYLPGHFVDMVIAIFHVSESTASSFLFVAGVLDLLVAVLIFEPRFSKYALLYAFVWGMLTALARITAGFTLNFPLISLHDHLYLTVYRIPNGLVPLFAVLLLSQNLKTSTP